MAIEDISFDVDLHSARDPSTSVNEGYLGTFDSSV